MENPYWLLAPLGMLAAAFFFWFVRRGKSDDSSVAHLRAAFFDDRARLNELFLQTAARSGKPRGLRWKECQWSDLTEWVREKQTGRLLALAGVTISFAAIEGGEMEGIEAVGNLRNATAVFFYQDGRWQTGGRVVFNMNPDEALAHFQTGYERID